MLLDASRKMLRCCWCPRIVPLLSGSSSCQFFMPVSSDCCKCPSACALSSPSPLLLPCFRARPLRATFRLFGHTPPHSAVAVEMFLWMPSISSFHPIKLPVIVVTSTTPSLDSPPFSFPTPSLASPLPCRTRIPCSQESASASSTAVCRCS